MPTHNKLIIAALCLPLVLAGCSDKDEDAAGTSPTSPAPAGGSGTSPGATLGGTPSLSARPTFSPGYPVASIYVVTAGPGVTDQDLKDAMTTIAEHEGVEGVTFTGQHQLRVEMSLVDLVKRAKPVYDDLVKLGTVTTP